MPTDYERVRDSIAYIAAHAPSQPSLEEVAAHAGLSPAHLQRVFRRWAGVSPKRFLQQLTTLRAQELLRDSVPVIDAAFEAGLSGPSRLHDLMVVARAVTPGEYATRGAGLTIRLGVHDTPFGTAVIGMTDRGICALRLCDAEGVAAAIDEVETEWCGATVVRDDASTGAVIASIFQPANRTDAPLTLLLRGTNFQLRVWEALLRVPDHCVISYSDLAERLGEPRATRAVASAVGANPIAYVIPCHRVLRANGALGGYRWGLDRKLVMLERETMETSR